MIRFLCNSLIICFFLVPSFAIGNEGEVFIKNFKIDKDLVLTVKSKRERVNIIYPERNNKFRIMLLLFLDF